MRKRTDEKTELGQLVKGDDTDSYVMEKRKSINTVSIVWVYKKDYIYICAGKRFIYNILNIII